MKPFIAVLFFTLSVLCPSIALAENAIQATSPNFVLSGEIPTQDAADIIMELEEFRAALLDLHDIPSKTKDFVLDIYIVSDPEIFKILDVGEAFVAIYSPSIAGPRVIVNGNTLRERPDYLRHSLRHEYVHHFNSLYQKIVIPQWMDEGLAEYYAAYEKRPDGQFTFGKDIEVSKYIMTYPTEGWISMERILASFASIEQGGQGGQKFIPQWKGPHPYKVDLFYAQSWALVHYMMNQENGLERLDGHNEYLIGITSGNAEKISAKTHDEYIVISAAQDREISDAFIRAYRFGEAEFPAILQNYITAEKLPVKTIALKSSFTQPATPIKQLTEIEFAALQYRLMSTVARGATINSKMKELRVRLDAAPEMELSLLVSDAVQQKLLGANALAIEKLDQALAINPNVKDATILKIQTLFEELNNQYFQNGEKVRSALRSELAKQPENPLYLVIMAVSGVRDIDEPPAEVTNALQKIEQTQLVRRHPMIAFSLVNHYVAKEEYETALYIARRANLFFPGNSFPVIGIIHELEQEIERASKSE